ncbi:hypothetical protein BV898_03337 [Hypsibius exemplaris]|uniref:G-protein coupled receptors family 1 profile domain-containing protein n=1 Tax=Hypsibius exemplaris TaxID=2072580 RepID=A0A1W0X6F8_HYPEX|nr:hypothetical protein BV898_03337 [Hypsibius exemplaris]
MDTDHPNDAVLSLYCHSNEDAPRHPGKNGQWTRKRTRHRKLQERQAFLVLSLLLLAVFIFWSPWLVYSVQHLWFGWKEEYDRLRSASYWIAYAMSGLNPFLFNAVSGDMRKTLARILPEKLLILLAERALPGKLTSSQSAELNNNVVFRGMSTPVSTEAGFGSRIVDKIKKEAPVQLLPAFVRFATVGGLKVSVKNQEDLSSFTNYSGCISNVRIEVPDRLSVQALEPLKTGVRKETIQGTLYHFTGPDVEESQCAAPPLPTMLTPGLADTEPMETDIKFPYWDSTAAVAQEYSAGTPKPGPESSPRHTGIIVGVLCGIFLLAILIGLLIYVRRLKRNKKNNYSPDQLGQEPTAHDALLMRHDPVADPEAAPLSQREKTRQSKEPFGRPVTSYIDEHIIPPPNNTRVQELEKHLEGSNGSSVNQDEKYA